MAKAIFGSTLMIVATILFIGTFITTAVASGGGVDITEMIYSSMWNAFPVHIVVASIVFAAGLGILVYEVFRNKS
ncbi:hypothetical protein [Geomicrobium sp. JCM 19039]|uniref:hypothetical protein n=1 Tax=Geomicrobium sp. JCM 19039 TaxID=1460636 RepID=UPI00045F4249|nr:hypothetical protein [Geomicrobium sp. JCM 19039]GAK11997.1 hypothetical protein JCM19039_1724 [Geomicrobium sp. JCM 19039]